MKALLATVALATLLGTPSAWAQECLIHDWLNVSNFTISSVGDSVVVSAELSSIDERNPADYYFRRADPAHEWRFGGELVSENDGKEHGLSPSYDMIRIGVSPWPWYSPVSITPTRFEFRFPRSILAAHRFRYECTFDHEGWEYGGCQKVFTGTFDLTDPTPTRRVSLGGLKAAYR